MDKRPPSLESLRILEACVRHDNFTRAAVELGLSPAAVSLRIRNLESELGARLFERAGPHLKVTAGAVTLAAQLAEAFKDINAAVTQARGRTQTLRVTAPPSFTSRWLAPRLVRYHRRADAASVQVDCSSELRSSDEFDVAIRTGLEQSPAFTTTRLMPVEVTPMLSPSLAASVQLSSAADIAKLLLLPHDDWRAWFQQAGVRVPRLRFCADEYPTHELDAAAAMEGAGVALLSPILFASALREGKLIQPFETVVRGPKWHFLLTKPTDPSPAVRGFKAWLATELAGLQQ